MMCLNRYIGVVTDWVEYSFVWIDIDLFKKLKL